MGHETLRLQSHANVRRTMKDKSPPEDDLGDLSLDDIEAELKTPRKKPAPAVEPKPKTEPGKAKSDKAAAGKAASEKAASGKPSAPRKSARPMDEKKPRRFTFLLVGLVLGVVGTLFLPPLVRPYLPEGLRGSAVTVSGPVLAMQLEETSPPRLLLTVQAEQGALLATFTERVAEINLLVDQGDSITLGVVRYEPFVENPSFEGVVKGEGTATLDAVEEGQPAGEGGDAAGESGDTEGSDLDAAAEEPGESDDAGDSDGSGEAQVATPQDTIPVPGSPG